MGWTQHESVMRRRRRSSLLDIVLETWAGYARHRTGRNASLLAYFGVLTIFPLLLGATTLLGLVLEDRPDLQDDIVDSAFSKIPVIGTQIEQSAGHIDGSWWALVIGLGGALWGSLRAFLALQTALDDIWEVNSGRGNYLTQRVRALTCVGVFGLAQGGAIVLAVLVGQAGLPRTSQFLLTFGGLAINIALVALMYRYVTVRALSWSDVWPGALLTAVLFTALQFAGANIMANTLKNASVVYGAFGSLLALTSWISLHGLTLLVGADLNAALTRLRERDQSWPEPDH